MSRGVKKVSWIGLVVAGLGEDDTGIFHKLVIRIKYKILKVCSADNNRQIGLVRKKKKLRKWIFILKLVSE